MSNCIILHSPKNRVFFPSAAIDRAGLAKLLTAASEQPLMPLWEPNDSEETSRAKTAWWFLLGAVDFCEEGVLIRFGEGHSTHTWRDFKALLQVLRPFIQHQRSKVFRCSDESDGCRAVYKLNVDFKTGEFKD